MTSTKDMDAVRHVAKGTKVKESKTAAMPKKKKKSGIAGFLRTMGKMA